MVATTRFRSDHYNFTIARHALAGDPRVRAMGLIDTEVPTIGWRFRLFVSTGRLPRAEAVLRGIAGAPRVRRNPFAFGGAFADPSLLDGDFDELFLRPLRDDPERLAAAVRTLRSVDLDLIHRLPDVHARITVPVQLVWGERDVFFPVRSAQDVVDTFPDARLAVVEGAGLFAHEERPAEVAAALLPTLLGARQAKGPRTS